ncbi:MAG TPA: sulfatase-like hydrolase/transferase, partial [Actinomycetota bacterium]|nr:sulfatase-like hydrolase/transferase [Actinomycetota bacterium]
RFKNYNVEAQCTPTRSAILSGRLPIRTGNCSVPLPGQGDYGRVAWEYTLGELFSDAGYATGAFGKWHVGDKEGRLPTDQGFDEWYGIKNTSDESAYSTYPLFTESGVPVPKIWEGVKGSPVSAVADFNLETRARMDEQIAARTAAFITRNAQANKPFFTYVCFTQVHPPLLPHPDFKGKSGGGTYSDAMAELDYRTGQVLDAIDQAGIAEDTIVVWSSDNPAGRAPYMGGSNGPWRGHFASGFEGGMRAPAMVRWPGKVPAGAVTEEIFATYDWLPTLASLVAESNRVPDDRPIDGVDASAFLLGQRATTGRDHVIYFGSDAEVMSVKWRTMKVVLRYTESTSGPIIKPQWPLIFDLIDDPGEEWDLMDKRLDCIWVLAPVAQRLGALMQSAARYPNIKPGQEFTGYQ